MEKWYRKGHLKRSGKRWLAILLCACMIGTMIPISARAETGETEDFGYEQEEENDEVKNETTITITAWQWIDEEDILDPETGSLALPGASEEHPASFEDVVGFLPTQILATVENAEDTEAEAASENITLGDWACEEYPKEGAYSGSYTFVATLPEGYVLSEEAEALTVLVELGGAQMYEGAESVITGAFTVTGGTSGTDYTYENNVLTIKSETPVKIANTDPNTSTTDRIEVASGINANITLAGVNIKVSTAINAAAFKIADDSSGDVTITLADGMENTLKSERDCAGLQKNGDGESIGKLTIQGGENGTGKLTATGGIHGAGIGGGNEGSGSNITISGGTVEATSQSYGAGIGGGNKGSGSNITISGGTVTATGSDGGAGIGGGDKGSGSNITISGGTVTATGSAGGAGIGGGNQGTGSDIEISAGTVTATGGIRGAGIGGGCIGSGSNITISNSTVTATGGMYGSGIGNGDGGNGGTIAISNSFVMASSISDTSSQDSWSGLIFNGEAGKVYGESFTISTDCTIPEGKTLVVAADQTISIADTKAIYNDGTIYNNGIFTGTVTNYGTIHNTGTFSNVKYGIINQYSISIEQIENSCQSVELSLKVNDTAFEETVTYSLNEAEANAVIENGNTLKVADSGVGTPIPVTVTFTVNDVSMTRTESVTITSGHVYDNNGFCTICNGYQPATKNTEDCYEIGNAGQLYWFAGKVNNDNSNFGSAKAVLTKDIVVNKNVLVNGELNTSESGSFRSWTPIGNDNNAYTGTFDGQGHTVSGLYFDDGNEKYVGLFGFIQSGSCIKKVGVLDSYFNGKNSVGGVCGLNQNGTIENCYSKSYVSGTDYVGGVCGWNRSVHGLSEIKNCYNVGKVSGTGDTIGGVCGLNSQESGASATVTNCYYLAGCNTEGTNFTCEEGTSKTSEEFASGLVCYLLNGSSSENSVWYQNIDLDGVTADPYPVLDSNHGTIYQCTPCTAVYSNTPDKTVAHTFHVDENDNTKHTCEKCGATEAHSTTNFTYSADEETNRITVYCNEGGCGTNIGYVELAAPSGTMTYNGIGKEATISDTVPSVDFSSTTITYKQGETTLSSEPVNAGTYTASITLGTGEGAATVSVEFTIEKATPTISWGMSGAEITSQSATYTGTEIATGKLTAPTVTLVNGETYSGEISYSYRVQGSSDAFTSGLPTAIGTYEIKASIAADGNYTAAENTITLEVDWLETIAAAVLTNQKNVPLYGDDWWAQSVTFKAPDGFTIGNSVDGTYGSSFDYDEQTGADGTEVTYYLKNSDGEIAQKTAIVRVDKTAPTWPENGGIRVKENWWKKLANTISFGLFYKDATVDVKACAADDLSGVSAYYYYVDKTGSTTILSSAELENKIYATIAGSGEQTLSSLSSEGSYVVYAYAIDNAGNRSDYVCTNGVVLDRTAPTIDGITVPSKEELTLTDTSAKISFTGSEAGTCFYMISETELDDITDFATSSENSQGMTIWTANSGVSSVEMTTEAKQITVSSLSPNTTYTLYLAAVDQAGNSSTVYSQTFTTCKTMPTITTNPSISGTYGQTVADMKLTDGVAKVGSTVITGMWELIDSNKADIPAVGTTDTYQVTFTPADTYGGIYDTVIVPVKPTVSKRAITVAADDKTKTYGQANPAFTFAITEGTLVGTDTEEALGITLSCAANESSPVKEGGYAITGTSNSANYEVTVNPGILTINKADAQITIDTGKDSYSKNFGDAAFTLSGISDTNNDANVQYAVTVGDDVLSVSNGTVTILKAGTATITVSLPASTNYNAAASKTITVTVAKKSGYTVDEINRRYYYLRDNADTIDLSGYLPANCGTVSYGTPQVNGELYTDGGKPEVSVDGKLSYTVKRAETYDATGTIQATVTTDNYADFTIMVNVSLVDQIPVSLKSGSSVTLQNSTLTYGQTLSTLTFNSAVFVDNDGHEVTGTLAWKTPDEKPNTGTTSATWVFTPTDEAYAVVEDTVGITVNKATPVVTAVPTVADRTYSPTVSLTNDDLAGGTVSVSGSWSWQSTGIIPTVNNTGYVAIFTPTDSTNYETVTRTITVTVTKATPYIATAPTAAAITYGDTLGASTLTGGTVQYSDSDATTVAGSFTWNDNAVKPGVSDSNITIYQVLFTPSDTVNYNTAETDITLIVNKADNAPNMPSSTMNVANSCKKVSDVTLPTDWVWQDADKDTALTIGTAVTATAEYNGADKGNYENETVSVSIIRSACDHAHTEVRNAKEATCSEAGYTGDTYCTDCGSLLTSGTAIPLEDHQGGTATCTKKAVCTVCGKEYGALDANNHVHTEIRGAVAATCIVGGYTGDTYCTDCGVKTKMGTATPALGHHYISSVTKQPTTSSEGVMTYTCDRCGHSYTRAIAKLQDTGNNNAVNSNPGNNQADIAPGDNNPTDSVSGDNGQADNSPTGNNSAGSEPTDNKQGEGNTPDTGKPYIKDENGKEGWDVIKDEVDKIKDGDTVTVEMNGSAVVPGNVLDEIKGKDVTIVFDMGNGISWSVNGQSITGDKTGDIDFSVKIGTNTIPVDIIKNITGERKSRQISLAYDGEFGFTAVLSINMEASNAGMYANLFYFNEKTGELEFICADEIAADGTAELTFTHASDYAIVIDKDPMDVASNETADTNVDVSGTASESQDTETEATQTGAEGKSDAWNPWWIIVIGIMVIVIGAGVFFVVKKREENEKE